MSYNYNQQDLMLGSTQSYLQANMTSSYTSLMDKEILLHNLQGSIQGELLMAIKNILIHSI